jgi:hypothetical protein
MSAKLDVPIAGCPKRGTFDTRIPATGTAHEFLNG